MQKWEANFQDKQMIFNVSLKRNTQVTKKNLEKFKLTELLR